MRKPTLPSLLNPRATTDWGIEDLNFKEVYFPDEPDLESLKLTEARQVFEAFGYQVLVAQKPTAHPVYVLRLRRHEAPHFIVEDYFQEHIRELLRSIGVKIPRTTRPAHRQGNRILVSFLWEPPRKSRRRRAN